MPTLFHLSTCSTCRRIISELGERPDLVLQDIKTRPLSAEQLAAMRERADSYESLFTRRSRQFRARGLHERELSEDEYRRLILEEYTFLKRPVLLTDEAVFAGNAKATVAAMREALDK